MESLKNVGAVMLKPDGATDGILPFAVRLLLQEECVPLLILEDLAFTKEEAKAFYPKDDIWRKKYGKRLLGFWEDHNMPIPEVCHFSPSSSEGQEHLESNVGHLILERMAEYLSSSPCSIIIFATEGDPFIAAKEIVGQSAIPAECDKNTLRWVFNGRETLEQSYLENRALRNVAHSSENLGELRREIKVIISSLNSKQTHYSSIQARYLLALCERSGVFI